MVIQILINGYSRNFGLFGRIFPLFMLNLNGCTNKFARI